MNRDNNFKNTIYLLIIVFALSLTLSQSAYAVFPTWGLPGAFSLNDGGVQGAGIPSLPVTVQVVDPAASGSGTITVRITSSVFDQTTLPAAVSTILILNMKNFSNLVMVL